ncbi:FtsX-like permease family protein [Streptomyces sp. NPDC049954]|uniref:FtsX-like permease family protein n=1 Tax=Streptomyces sp. NPDC049954 TaxID=3155779 RepID=UPI0034224239
MNTFALGLRLVLRGNRATRVRFLLMTAGCALGVACLAAVLTIPALLAAHDGREAARGTVPGKEGKAGRSSAILALKRTDPYGSHLFTRVFVARPEQGNGPVPPGMDRLPGPGEVLVSPELRDLLREHPGLKPSLPGKVTGTIGAAGLTGPRELYAYVGRTHAQLPDGEVVHRFGDRWPSTNAVDSSTLDPLRFTLCCLVLLPLAVYFSVCVRLSADSRGRRLAALRLLGLSARQTMRVSAVETLCAALLGAVLGLGLHLVVNAVVAETGLPGIAWYPSDGLPSTNTLAACLLGCPALAYLAGRRHAREAALRPLAVRRQERQRRARWLGALLLLPGLGIVSTYCVLGALGRIGVSTSLTSVLVPAGALLTGAGLVFALPPATGWLARRIASVTQRLPLTLAMRHNESRPGAVLRVVSGLVVLVYAGSLTQGVLVEIDQVSRRIAPVQEYEVAYDKLTPAQRAAMKGAEGVRSYALTVDTNGSRSVGVLVGDCAQVRVLAKPGSMRGCVDGQTSVLSDPQSIPDPGVDPGRAYSLDLRTEDGRPAGTYHYTIPRRSVVIGVEQPSSLQNAVLIPPSALPPGTHPAGAHLVLSSAPDSETVRRTLDRLAGIAPTAEITPVGIVIESLSQLSVIKGLLGTGMVLGLVIGVAAFLVSAADRAMDRRGQITTLTLLGARSSTLRAAQCAQVLLPLALGLGGALVAGRLAESSYLVTGGGAVFWDGEGLPLLLLSSLGVLLVAGLAALPMVRRHLDPEVLRGD